MLRFFMSPHPTFGSYKRPVQWKVEASPYFWWWYALTLNDDYLRLCEQGPVNCVSTDAETGAAAQMQAVYADFGDVRYEACRYAAFACWWAERVTETERRGEYLFAEPLHKNAVRSLQYADDAAASVDCADTLVIAVPLNLQRQHIDKAMDRLLRKHLVTEKGRTVRNPNRSEARYSLSKPILPKSLKKTFDVYDARCAMEAAGEKVDNAEIAKLAKIKYTERVKADGDVYDDAMKRRVVSATIARHVRDARSLIDKAALGRW